MNYELNKRSFPIQCQPCKKLIKKSKEFQKSLKYSLVGYINKSNQFFFCFSEKKNRK